MAENPKYLSDTPYGEDFFKIHSKIAETLFEIIKSEDVSKNSFTLGLLGSWGSGKSMTVGILKEKLNKEKDIIFLEFDIWKYIDSSLYRSILIDLEKSLKETATSKKINDEFKNGYKSASGENLYDLLYSHTEFTVAQDEKSNDKLLQIINKWESIKYLIPLSYLILRPINLVRLIIAYIFKRFEIVVVIGLFIFALVTAYVFRAKIYEWMPFTSSNTFKFIIKLFIGSVLGVAALEFLKEFFKDAYKELTPKVSKNIVITSPPTFAQDQFEGIFRNIIGRVCTNSKKKVVIVFDNIDRCETDVTLKVLTGLKTFLDVPNCFYLIPCDDDRIKKHFKESRADNDFLDKIFQAYLRIPLLTEENKFEFIEKCLTDANFNFNKSDRIKISQILTLAYRGETPRQIKRFFNDFISYYKLAKTVDPAEKILLKDITHFTFMVTIKQKWPQIEETLIKNPNAFINFNSSQQNVLNFPPDFTAYLQTCISWIDLDSNPSDFVYLTEAKQTGSNIQKILIENFDGFNLTLPIIKDFSSFLTSLRSEEKFLFLETAIDRLMTLTNKFLKENENTNGIELFKLYIDWVVKYDKIEFENKKQSYILSHSSFFAENVDFISKLDRNIIQGFEQHACNIIHKTGFNEITSTLYSNFLQKFSKSSLMKVFENSTQEEVSKLNGFIAIIPKDQAWDVIPKTYFTQLNETITFTKEEGPSLSVYNHLNKDLKFSAMRKPLTLKLDQVLASYQGHQPQHPYDKFIIDGLKILHKDDWDGIQKNSSGNNVNARVQVLVPHGFNDQAIDYCIYSLSNDLTGIVQLLNVGNVLGNNAANFNLFVNKIPVDILELALENQTNRVQILNTALTYNMQGSIYAKVTDQYLKEKTNCLFHNDLRCLSSIFEVLTARKSTFTNEELHDTERYIVSGYSQNFKDLVITNYIDIIPKLSFTDNKEMIIEFAIKHYNQNAGENSTHLTNLLRANETTAGFLDKTYESNKIQFQSIDTLEFFDFLFYNQLFKNKSDYLERILQRDLSALKAGKVASVILKTIERVDTTLLVERKSTLALVINELIEQSRSEEDNTVGVKLYNRIKKELDRLNPSIKSKIELLKTHDSKSEVLKQLVSNIEELN